MKKKLLVAVLAAGLVLPSVSALAKESSFGGEIGDHRTHLGDLPKAKTAEMEKQEKYLKTFEKARVKLQSDLDALKAKLETEKTRLQSYKISNKSKVSDQKAVVVALEKEIKILEGALEFNAKQIEMTKKKLGLPVTPPSAVTPTPDNANNPSENPMNKDMDKPSVKKLPKTSAVK